MRHFVLMILVLGLVWATSISRFTKSGSGDSVIDNKTKLQWQDTSISDMNWSSAISSCEDLSVDSYHDWRLPNFNELYALADKSKSDPALDNTIFTNIPTNADYWSSTTIKDANDTAWSINFYDGTTGTTGKIELKNVRCVRAGR